MSALKLTIAGDGIAVVTLANPPINAMDAGCWRSSPTCSKAWRPIAPSVPR